MKTVRHRLDVFVSLMRGDDNVHRMAAHTHVEFPLAGLNFLNRLLLTLLPPAVVGVHPANIANTLVRIVTIGLIYAANACTIGHAHLPSLRGILTL
jgi:hypothetical protein